MVYYRCDGTTGHPCVAFIMLSGGVFHKVLVRLGIGEPVQETADYTLSAWSKSLDKMYHDADVVFFGDSITEQSDFQKYFPDVDIVELGLGGDTIVTLKNRADMVSMVTPEKIFILVGINQLKQDKLGLFGNYYRTLIETLKTENPNAQIYIQSLLPISKDMEERYCANSVIDKFNEELIQIADEYGATYIDINSAYKVNGYMNDDWTTDGVHLKEEGYNAWADIIDEYIYH